MTTNTTIDRKNTIADAAKKASLANVANNVAKAQAAELTNEASAARVALIEAAYKTEKGNNALDRQFYTYYVRDIVKAGGALNTALPHFKNAIAALFEAGQLETVEESEESERAINAVTLYSVVRRLLIRADYRYQKARNGGKAPENKGTDDRDNEIAGSSFFKSSKLADIAEAFTVQADARQEKIITTLFLQIVPERRAALLLDLEAMQDLEVPELDDIK